MIRVLENEFYYLDNFQRVLDWIAQRYADLLDDEERSFIDAFARLSRPSQALFVRMVMRKGSLFRASKLNYPEIGCPLAAAQELLPTGWIVSDPTLAIDELFDLLVKPEILEAFALSGPLKSARKPDQLEALREQHREPRPFSQWYEGCADTVFAIRSKPLCDRLRLIFFGNLHQDWTEFVLSDLGLFRYEQVEFSEASRGFRSRQDIEHYLQLHACRERFDALEPGSEELHEEIQAVLGDLPRHSFGNDWLDSRREKLLFRIGQRLEKDKHWEAAHAVYAGCRFPGARSRAMRVLEKDEKFDQAYALFCEAEQAPESEAERQHLLRIGPRLARKLGHAKTKAKRAAPAARLDLNLPIPGGEWRVEGVVLGHLHRDEAPVYYVENALANTLFGLLCWPAVFAAIPGAFFHPFHRGPADLYSPDFQQRRAREFEACLARLDDGSHVEAILGIWDKKAGIQSPFVAWDWLDRGILELALACIPADHLKLWFLRILQDVKDNRTGFPDLIQFFPLEKRYDMIEVKGPGDRLQDNQLRWIDYCAEHGMPVTVCYLQWEQAA
ncbi:nuclease [Massilia sp. WF1]|uniref:VRR-NUC domain-containing protein n=1 Tax=unclassified Massilia TaxID=2609279 RepID=UPI00064A6915|nr:MULTISPECIES: VRR-NUC domain-containing protein [unclassified Massilia]ALK96709.1 nuclease [Massilia sp. WG5]KLU38052.1 nuclease [Massilia sp. WF1]